VSYGLIIKDAAGNVTLDTDSTMLRFVGSGYIEPNASGTISMPGFEENDGFFVPSFKMGKFRNNGPNPSEFRSDATPFGQFAEIRTAVQPFELPDLLWNNETKILTYTDNTVPDDFGGFNPASAIQQKVYVRFYIFKGGTTRLGNDFGLVVKNEYGDTVVSFEKTLHVRETGTTKSTLIDGPFTLFSRMLDPAMQMPLGNSAATSAIRYVWDGFRDQVYAETVGRDDLAFYRIADKAITSSYTIWSEFPEINDTGSVPMVGTEDGSQLDYKIASMDLSGHSPTEDYGLLMKDAAGNITFDSRVPTIQIVKTQVISEAQINDILLNNAVVDITLPYAVPDPWICAPYHVSFRREQESANNGIRYLQPKITKLNDTTIRVSRLNDRWNVTKYSGSQAMWIIVAK